MSSFADGTAICPGSLHYEEANQKLSNKTLIVQSWFRINIMVVNPGKFLIIHWGKDRLY